LVFFIGGRALPGRYPEPASSLLLRQRDGTWQIDAAASTRLKELGLVNAATWSDLDGDGFAELILALEWGPLRIFQNSQGQLNEVTERLGLSERHGLWTSVATGDFDGDGRLDIVAGNWGLNSEYEHPSPANPLRLYYGDFAGAGTVELMEAERDPISGEFAPRQRLDILATSMPALLERFPSHQAFSEATIAEILQKHPARHLQANSLATTLFLNRGGHFEARELPMEAQLAPVFGITVADFDGNGTEDLFLAQNFFATRPEVPRLDAGRGLLLLNDGAGNFSALPGQAAGITVYGEQRGAAQADYDQDGRVDLVVTQNGAATRLFRNQTAWPGLRVRLAGPPGNPDGIGAALRMRFSQAQGPVREIKAGAGYYSQDSAVQVLATPQSASQLWIRWPGGRETTTDLPAGLREVFVGEDGRLR
jgi:enediyne biosynthesis protein E4